MEQVTRPTSTEHPVLVHFLRRAADVADCAVVEVHDDGGDTSVVIKPHREGALGVYLWTWGDVDEDSAVGFDGDDFCEEEVREPHEVDWFLDAAIEGRVRVLRRRLRGAAFVDEGDGYKEVSRWDFGLTWWLPMPGWRRRATVIDYAPYRDD